MNKSSLLIPVLASALLIPVLPANAASACKGMDEASCVKHQVFQGVQACNWIKERQTASGSTVKAHCRGSNRSVPADAVKITQDTPKQPTN